MRITHRIMADNVRYNLQQNMYHLNNYSRQLSTGKVFDRPSQDPVGANKVMFYSASIVRNEQFRLNMNESRNWLDTTESSLADTLDVFQRVRELTVYGATDSLTNLDRSNIAAEVGELYDHMVGLANSTNAGLYIFAGHQTLEKAYEEKKIYRAEVSDNEVIALNNGSTKDVLSGEGMQNGSYEVVIDFDESINNNNNNNNNNVRDAGIVTGQEYLQDTATSIIGPGIRGGVTDNNGDPLNVNASILLEVKEVDTGTGLVTYDYESHEYDRDGEYSHHSGEVTLNFSGASSQTVTIGAAQIEVSGLGNAYAGVLRPGDKAVWDLQAARPANTNEVSVSIKGDYRGSAGETNYFFNNGTLDDKEFDFKFFSLNEFPKSIYHGKAYDSNFSAQFSEVGEEETTLTFSYDDKNFPVYQGNGGTRIQEISAYQDVTMNFSGYEAFGGEHADEAFVAIKAVYWALWEDDRDTLGGDALQQLDDVIDNLLNKRAEAGARLHRIEAMHSTLFEENIYMQETRANVEDIDIPYTVTRYQMQENAYRAALATASRIMQPTLVDYMR